MIPGDLIYYLREPDDKDQINPDLNPHDPDSGYELKLGRFLEFYQQTNWVMVDEVYIPVFERMALVINQETSWIEEIEPTKICVNDSEQLNRYRNRSGQ